MSFNDGFDTIGEISSGFLTHLGLREAWFLSEINKRMIFPNTYKGRVDIYFLSELEHPDVYREISKFGNW